MATDQAIYMCPTCFEVTESMSDDHRHRMIYCQVGQQGDEQRKPIRDREGHLTTRAPRWFWEAVRSHRMGAVAPARQ